MVNNILSHNMCNVNFYYTNCVKYIYMSEKLKLLRRQKNVTQKEVAAAIGITLSAYSNYEQGIREPSLQILISICKYFDVSSDYLLGLDEYI